MIVWMFCLFSVISNGSDLSWNILIPWHNQFVLFCFVLSCFNIFYPETKQNKNLFAGKIAYNLGTGADGIFPFFHHLPNWIPGKLLHSHFSLSQTHRNSCVTCTYKVSLSKEIDNMKQMWPLISRIEASYGWAASSHKVAQAAQGRVGIVKS